MSNNQDYALAAVPDQQTVSGVQIALVKIGIIIALPAFISGAEIGFALGFERGIASIALGGLILAFIAAATGAVGARSRLSTAMITRFAFGSFGGRMISLVLVCTQLGWFGVTAGLFGRSMAHILADFGFSQFPPAFYTILGGMLMTATTIYGFSALQKLSNFTVPLLLAAIAYTAYVAWQRATPESFIPPVGSGWGLSEGVSAIVGGLAAGVTTFPDLCRFARKTGDARLAAGLTFALAMPLILLLALIPSTIMHEKDLMILMVTLGLGGPAVLLLVVKAWATNAGNLYSASLSAANVFEKFAHRKIVIGAGIVGTAAAALGVSDLFVPFLVLLGVTVPPIAGIYVVDFFLVRRGEYDAAKIPELPAFYPAAFACWAFGISIAIAARTGLFTFTGIAACDAIIAASGSYFLLRHFIRHSTVSA
jgi:cytosine permease